MNNVNKTDNTFVLYKIHDNWINRLLIQKYYLIKINKTINVKFVGKVVNFKFIPIWVIIFSYRISLFFHLALLIVFYFGRHCLMISCTDVLCILCIILWWVRILLFVRLGTEWNWARISCVGTYYFWIFYLEV